MECKICHARAQPLFETKVRVLNRYLVDYWRCPTCSFIQTQQPFWLAEAYNSAITSLDIGLISRNISVSRQLASVILSFFDQKGAFLDYGGGYGMLVRIMRDRGYDFYRYDIHCDNLFAKHFDIEDCSLRRFELVTAFEVFEHLVDPVAETEKMLKISDSVFFSTELSPSNPIRSVNDWWYFTPGTGQHIALYSADSLIRLAARLSCNFYTNGKNLHLITKRKINPVLFKTIIRNTPAALISKFYGPTSLLMKDFGHIQSLHHNAL